jgi:hypothetical protein
MALMCTPGFRYLPLKMGLEELVAVTMMSARLTALFSSTQRHDDHRRETTLAARTTTLHRDGWWCVFFCTFRVLVNDMPGDFGVAVAHSGLVALLQVERLRLSSVDEVNLFVLCVCVCVGRCDFTSAKPRSYRRVRTRDDTRHTRRTSLILRTVQIASI